MDQKADMDELLVAVGWWGKYQRIQFLMNMLPVLACGLHVLSIVFIGRNIEYKCSTLDSLNVTMQTGSGGWIHDVTSHNFSLLNVTVTYGSCSVDVKNGSDVIFTSSCLNGYNYSEPKDKSIVSQWDLVCDREALSDFTQTILSLGQLAGALICTGVADIYGRKPTYIVSHLILFAAAIALSFSPNYIVFLVLRFIIGLVQQGTGLVSNVLLLEILPTKRRALPSQVGSFVWPGALLLLGVCAYITKDLSWQYTELLLGGLSCYVLVQWWIMDESPRWLLANNRIKDFEQLLKKITRMNKTDYNKALIMMNRRESLSNSTSDANLNDLASKEEIGEYEKATSHGVKHVILSVIPLQTVAPSTSIAPLATAIALVPEDEIRFSAFFKNKNVFIVTALSCFMWFTDSLTYYGLIMTSTSLTDDFYLGYFVNVLVELPAAVAFGVLINKIGRKSCTSIFHIIGGVSLLASVILNNAPFAENIPGKTIITLIVSLIGKFGISVSFGTLFQYTPELYPTNLRNTGFGISSMAARIGGMVAPYSRTFERHVPWGPGAVFTFLCLLVPFLVRYLPETHGHELPQTIAEMDQWLSKTGTKLKTKRAKKINPEN